MLYAAVLRWTLFLVAAPIRLVTGPATGATRDRRAPLDAPLWRLAGLGRPIALGLALALLVAAVMVAATTLGATIRLGKLGVDLGAVTGFAQRWLDAGSMYLPGQMAGPFEAQPAGWSSVAVLPSMYPPPAVLLFLPFLWLPAIAWWLVPLAALAVTVAHWRPAAWTWPLMAAAFVLPATSIGIWVGGTTMWIAAFVALGLRYGGPGVLVLLKPSLFPFALAGVRRRSWWIVLAGWCALALVMLPAWLDYVSVVRNGDAGILYSLTSVPLLLVPVVAYMGRRPAS